MFNFFRQPLSHSQRARCARSAILCLLLAGCQNPLSTATPQPSPGASPAPANNVVALGRLEPEGEVIKLSVPNAQDSRVNQILVKEGDRVVANQVIAILQGIERREADLRDAEAEVRLRQAELLKIQQGDSKLAQLAAQKAAIEKLKAQLASSQIQQQAAIDTANANLRNAELTAQRRQQLQQQGAIAQSAVDEAHRDRDIAQATRREKTASLTQTIETLEAEISQETSRLSALSEVRPVDVEIAQAQLEKARIAVTQKAANLRDAEVRVPIGGQILRINTRVGEQVNTQQGIVELAKTSQMYAIAEIPESSIGKVRQGQTATISSEYNSFSGELTGVVQTIGLQVGKKNQQDPGGSSPTTDQNARVVVVKVKINPKDSDKVASFTNMQVRIKLSTDVPRARLAISSLRSNI
jgi:HlyD family secretion protein